MDLVLRSRTGVASINPRPKGMTTSRDKTLQFKHRLREGGGAAKHPVPQIGSYLIHYTEEELRAIRDILFRKTGLDINAYKDKCIQRRISLRVRSRGCSSPLDYVSILESDAEEAKRLFNTLTINVTEFFRNRSTFDELKNIVFPEIFRMEKAGSVIKIRSVGCASGDEPYTLAIIMKEYFPEELARFHLKIVATDVDENILNKAREGVYNADRLAGVDKHILERYFTYTRNGYQIANEIKEMVSFKREDLFHDGVENGNDLIICRNLLIYFPKERQEWVLEQFWKGLNPGGFLVLGRSEILVGESRGLFSTISSRERIYRKSE